ncbi:hypothetical protein QTG54_008300 [Skeletonema marinoi]|uniref:PS II complex 12 kDa extrinsic protein n=1 Tax=Skeletonema marinoi TaxID=267567 RepID=A0AAD8Y8B6_9STRA|nr:hypothetical protein QTG54_008300 [Skeletonema marinoi]
MQQLIALGLILLVSSASAFQIQSSMTQQQHRSHHTQQPLAATPTNNNNDSDDVSNTNNNPLHSRRNMLLGLSATNLAFLSSYASSANADVLRSAGCANGEGEACADLAEGNEFIQNLQKKSAQNKEANQREALNAYYMKNYPDVFAVSDKKMVKKLDGSYALFSAKEVDNLNKAGKIRIEYPTSKGGRIADLTQKPILVLNE